MGILLHHRSDGWIFGRLAVSTSALLAKHEKENLILGHTMQYFSRRQSSEDVRSHACKQDPGELHKCITLPIEDLALAYLRRISRQLSADGDLMRMMSWM